MNRKSSRIVSSLFVMLMALIVIAGCASSNSNTASFEALSDSKGDSFHLTENEAAITSAEQEAPAIQSGEAGSSDGAGGGLTADTAADLNGLNQKIIYTATLSMQVEQLDVAATSLRNAIHQSGGYILQFQDTKHEGEIGSSYTIKVPAAGFMPFIDRIEQIKHNSFERNIGGKDVSEEYVDLASRLKARQLVEARLLSMMDKAVKAEELLKFSEQLSVVQEEIERIKGRIRYLDNNVAFSTVELRMYQTDQHLTEARTEKRGLGGRMSDAIASSTKVVWEGINLLLVVLAGAVPVLVLLAIVGIPLLWLNRSRKRNSVEKPTDRGADE
ncbi:DUF4349 domain-containing protein [Paenibacillus sinopodophylli]|uniref:DUF4349 domain-containing protein n=1 Tax=Paenibacillus sinopodophylli TaxID=1837342 RepID=UPI00110D1CDC|nr:DUF4349 domain-containing protein [Paenibacillus sinopodophylli]